MLNTILPVKRDTVETGAKSIKEGFEKTKDHISDLSEFAKDFEINEISGKIIKIADVETAKTISLTSLNALIKEKTENFYELHNQSEINKRYEKATDKIDNFKDCEFDDSTNETKETRELTAEEQQELKEKLGWSDKQISKCTIDEDGVIHYKTNNSELEGEVSETGVRYERKTIEINGVKIEGVFPKFNSVFDTELPVEKYKSNAYAVECNKNLKEAIANDPELKKKFSDEQLKDISEGRTPTGYVWHHNEETGKMQLVERTEHSENRHTGGSALWGYDSVDKSQKENFNE